MRSELRVTMGEKSLVGGKGGRRVMEEEVEGGGLVGA